MLSNHDVSSPIIGTAILSFKDKASVGSPRIIGHVPVLHWRPDSTATTL